MKRLRWHDAELNRLAAQHALQIIDFLRPSDFIKARAFFLVFRELSTTALSTGALTSQTNVWN